MTKTFRALKEIKRIMMFEHNVLESPVIERGFSASVEENDDGTFYSYVECWGIFEIVEYDFSDGDREHALAALRDLAARLNLRVIGGIE